MTSLPDGISGLYFIGPQLSPVPPRRVVTDEERQRAEAFLVDVQSICDKHGLTLRSYDEYGIAVVESAADDAFAYCDEIWVISARGTEGVKWAD